MDPDDGLEEDEPLFPWLPPDDRLWRHPSELASSQFAASSDAPGAAGQPIADRSAAGIPAVGNPAARSSTGASAASRSAAAGGPGTVVGETALGLAVREVDRRLWAVALLAGVVGALLASGAGVVAGQYHHNTTVIRPIEQIVGTSNPYVTIADPKSDNIVDIAARLRPTIVELLVNNDGINGSGSGVIFRSDGYILTNDHVVDGAQSMVAVMSNGQRVNCRLIGTDPDTDIAVVKLESSKPEAVATLGTSTELKVGQLAIAIGSPLGMAGGSAVTSGIISATDRQVSSGNGPPLLDMIQTDAAIEPGSSGGALVDSNGMVVGITTAIALGNQGMQSFGFATPIEAARDVAEQLLTTGKVTHAWLGIEGGDVDLNTAQALGIGGGAIVQGVDSGSPAAQAGLAATDVVTAFADRPINSMSDLEMMVGQHRPGERVDITFMRQGQARTTQVSLVQLPTNEYP